MDVEQNFAVAIAAMVLEIGEAGLDIDAAHFAHDGLGVVFIRTASAATFAQCHIQPLNKRFPTRAIGVRTSGGFALLLNSVIWSNVSCLLISVSVMFSS